jgi:hypothetical protein
VTFGPVDESDPGRGSWAELYPDWLGFSAGTAITILTTMALAAASFGQSPRLVNPGGLFQRASIITSFAWLTALSARALQGAPATRSAQPPAA